MSDSASSRQENGFEIAIIGMSGRFPGARDVEEFWRNLRDGAEGISFFSDLELEAAGVSRSLLDNPDYVKARGVLEDVEMFDAAFFGFAPKEAEITDPQHRIFLESAWEGLERAGYNPERFKGLIGVYAGVGLNSYLLVNLISNRSLMESVGGFQVVVGNDKDYLPTRVSYKLNLKGPSVNVQTACSTSLVAVHLACRGLLSGECDIALAGGVAVSVPHRTGYMYQQGAILSPDGHCRAFDAQAKGIVGGSGVGVVVLKRLDDALNDGDHIIAVIKGSAINNDGSLKVGFTAPSVDGQAQVIRAAQIVAEVDPGTISYVETHGTGTALGDPIEIAALTQVFRDSTDRKQFCAIGSVKASVGHLDAAAGVTGLIKTALALKHRLIPPSLHFRTPNPQIDFANSPFYVNTQLKAWEGGGRARRAGVSSFGIGGTNAHLIVEEAPLVRSADPGRKWQLLVVSARTKMALEAATHNLAQYLEENGEVGLADVAYTLQVGRKAFRHRRAVVCDSLPDAVIKLTTRGSKQVYEGEADGKQREVVFMFPGQGAQHVNMCRGLYEANPTFRQTIDECAEALRADLGLDLRDVIYPEKGDEQEAGNRLNETYLTQPALFAVEVGMARALIARGLKPAAMIGHSIGEYAAACVAGVFGLKQGVRLVGARGRLMQRTAEGGMLWVEESQQEVGHRLRGGLSIAAVNGLKLCVVSGAVEDIEVMEEELRREGVASGRLATNRGFHSELMEEVMKEYEEEVKRVERSDAEIEYISNVTGKRISEEEIKGSEYWAKQMRGEVRFSEGIQEVVKGKEVVMVEVGPGRTLGGMVKREVGRGVEVISVMGRIGSEEGEEEFEEAIGRAWAAGCEAEWEAGYEGVRRRREELPTYPFERKPFWIDPPKQEYGASAGDVSLLKKEDIRDWFYIPSWKRTIASVKPGAKDLQHKSCWLVFMDSCGLGSSIAARLFQRGDCVITVDAGDEYIKYSERAYAINPRQGDDYETLLKESSAKGMTPKRILYLWGVTPDESIKAGEKSFDAAEFSFYSLIFLAQALGAENKADNLQIAIVSNAMQEVTGQEKLCPEKAMLLGACKVIPQEYPDVICRSIDIELPKTSKREEMLIDLLIGEFTTESSDAVIAYRGAYRWAQAFQPVRIDGAGEQPKRIREEGVFIITGGLGGVGLEVAEYLAQVARAKLVLVGRTEFPDREAWEDLLSAHDDELSRKIRKVQGLEVLGAEVLVARADVTSEEEMRGLIRRVRERFGKIHGVVHAAGIPGGGMIQLKTREMAERVLSPKVKGTRVLDSVLQGEDLDFFALCSSLRSITGGAGTVDYCAANAFLDAFAHYYNSRHDAVMTSINWDGWREIGMSNNSSSQPDLIPESSFGAGMSPKEAVDAFGRILSGISSQVVVSTHDLQAVIDYSGTVTASRTLGELDKDRRFEMTHPRPEISCLYVSPRNETEQTLAVIWQELLGIDHVGIYDNFFELGGDSVISIRIIARANQSGLRLSPKQVFDYQTIAELSAVADTIMSIQAEQGVVTGPVPLTPVQEWFFEQNPPDPHHWNQAALFEVRQLLDAALLEKVVGELLAHHDALRLRFNHDQSGWRQVNAEPDAVIPFGRVNLSELPEAEQELAIGEMSAEQQASLNLSEGPLMRVVLFDLGAQKANRLLIVLHHLVVDAISWRILLDDIHTGYQRLSRGETIEFPAKTTSFKQWAERLAEYAQSTELRQEAGYWLSESQTSHTRLPVDCPGADNTVASARAVSVSLEVEETRALLQEVPKAYNTQINDVLLTALVEAFTQWTGARSLLINLEGHGREAIFEDVDLSRTVGWFTTLFPVLLDVSESSDPGDALKTVKEQLRQIPNRGIGYGLLRYLSGDREIVKRMRALSQPEVSFLYLGQSENNLSAPSPFAPAKESNGPAQSPRGTRAHLLEISGSVVGGRLQMAWTYSENIHRRTTVAQIAQNFIEALRSISIHCQSPEAEGHTPSDFAEFGWSQKDFDNIMNTISETAKTT